MTPLRIMTFNIRFREAQDGANSWPYRREFVYETIRGHDPDLLAVQEPDSIQWEEVCSALPILQGVFGDRHLGPGPVRYGEALMFRRDRFEHLGTRVFWMSATPDVPGSVTGPNHWGARNTVAVRLRDREWGRELLFACTHLDTHPESWLRDSRVNAAELDRTAGGAPIILAGDFNCAAGSETWKFMTGEAGYRDAWTEAGNPGEGAITFHDYRCVTRLPLENPEILKKSLMDVASPQADLPDMRYYVDHVLTHRNYRIDWILLKGVWRAREARIDTRTWEGKPASDHWAVIAEAEAGG